MPMSQEVTKAIDALGNVPDRDAGTIELLRVYAGQIDQVAAIRRAADKALKAAEESGDETLIEQVNALRAKVSELSTVNTLGARLLSAFDALLMTPKSRAAATGKGAPADEQPANPLDELRQRRARGDIA